MKIQRKGLCFIVFALIFGFVIITGTFAQQYNDPYVVGSWEAQSLFGISGSGDEIDIYHSKLEDSWFDFMYDKTGKMFSHGQTIPFTWDVDEEETIMISVDAMGITMDVTSINENIISIISQEGGNAEIMVLVRNTEK